MGVHFPLVKLDNMIWSSTLFRMSGLLWYSSKLACRFECFLQYMSGLEVLACSLDTNLNYAPAAPFLEPISKAVDTFRRKMQQLLGCILIDRYATPAALSPDEFPSKMHNFLGSHAVVIISFTHMLPA